MKNLRRTIRIKFDKQAFNEEVFKSLQRWEDEGGPGNQPGTSEITVVPPIKKGQVFEVIDGEMVFDKEGNLYYEVEIDLLALS